MATQYISALKRIGAVAILIIINGCGGGGGGGGGGGSSDSIDLSAEISSAQTLQASTGPFLPFISRINDGNETLLRLVDVGAQPPQSLTLAERHVGALAYTEQTNSLSSSTNFFPTDLVYESTDNRLLRIGLRNAGDPANPRIISAENRSDNPIQVTADFSNPESSLVRYNKGNNQWLTELGAPPSQAPKSLAGKSILFITRTGGAINRLIIAESNRLVEYDRNLENPIVWLDNQPAATYQIRQTSDGTFYILQRRLNSQSSRLLRRRAGINSDLGFQGGFNKTEIQLTSTGVGVIDAHDIYFATHAENQVRKIVSFNHLAHGLYTTNDRLIVVGQQNPASVSGAHQKLYAIDPLTTTVEQLDDKIAKLYFIAAGNIYYTRFATPQSGIWHAGVSFDGSQQQDYTNIDDASFIGALLTHSDAEASTQDRIWLQIGNRIWENRPADGLDFTPVTTLATNERALRMVGRGRYLLLEASNTPGSEVADILLFDVDNPGFPQRITSGDEFNDRALF